MIFLSLPACLNIEGTVGKAILLMKWLRVKKIFFPSWFILITETVIILTFTYSLSLSLFQIQTRLQNLGCNLQNKSNDIEVLAVSYFYPFIPLLPIPTFFFSPTLSPYLLNSCVKSEWAKALWIAGTANISVSSCYLPWVKSLLLDVRWLWIYSSCYRMMNRRQQTGLPNGNKWLLYIHFLKKFIMYM